MERQTTETQNFYQLHYSDKFRNRQFKVVKAKDDVQAIDVLMLYDKNAKNIYAQAITEKEYNKIAANTYNPCAFAYASGTVGVCRL